MKILALDTSSTACSIAILINDTVKESHQLAPMQQAQLILPMIDELLSSAALKLDQLDAIAFGCGPGSFTGVRIATSVAQGLGFAAKVPLIPISSLAAIAQAAYADLGWKKLLVAIDARVQEIYWGAYRVNPQGLVELLGKEKVSSPADLAIPDTDEWYGIGNAWEVYRAQIHCQPVNVDINRLPMASAILTLARDKFIKRDWVEAGRALPSYLRDEVAKKSQKG